MIRLGRSFWWVITLTGISFLLSRLPWLANNLLYLRLTVTLGIVFIISAVWALFSLHKITLSRTTRTTRKQVGEVFIENFDVINQSVIPKVWINISDLSVLTGGTGSKVITGIGSKRSRSYVNHKMLIKRGWYSLGPTQIESGDVFGLFAMVKHFETNQRLLVFPYIFDLQFFLVPYGVLPDESTFREKTLEVTPYAAGVREYTPGDPLKRIHWPSSERKQKLIVKEFDKDPLGEVWIFLDARKAAHIRQIEVGQADFYHHWWDNHKKSFQLPPDTAEYAIATAASIARYYLKQKREVGLVSAGQLFSVLPAERGERQMGKILETLAVLEAEGELPIWALINVQVGHLTRGSTVILITPETNDQILTLTMILLQRGLIPVLILIDPAGFGGSPGMTDLADQLRAQGVYTYVIGAGDDIKAILEVPHQLSGYQMRI